MLGMVYHRLKCKWEHVLLFLKSVIWNDSIEWSYTVPEALGKIQNPHKIHLVSCFVMHSVCEQCSSLLANLLRRCHCNCWCGCLENVCLTNVYKHADCISDVEIVVKEIARFCGKTSINVIIQMKGCELFWWVLALNLKLSLFHEAESLLLEWDM